LQSEIPAIRVFLTEYDKSAGFLSAYGLKLGVVSLHVYVLHIYVAAHRGVNKFFKTLAKLASSLVFSLAKSENNWPKT
jgi:hypothetical protein